MADEGSAEHDTRPTPGRITRVILKNYKSIVSCDVELQPLTILVGPNGSGKSNFVDALAFVKEALTLGLEQAIRTRGNLDRILSKARPAGEDSLSIELHFEFAAGGTGQYGFTVGESRDGDLAVSGEGLTLAGSAMPTDPSNLFSAMDSELRLYDRLLLVRNSDALAMRPTYDLLTSMAFYNPLPDVMRELKPRDVSHHLRPDGANVASMLRRIQDADEDSIWGITQYMKRVLPGIEAISTLDLAGRDLLQVSVASDDHEKPYTFDADQLSDGTLRALAILVALFQHRLGGKSAPSLVGIEEPENNLHPATGGAFADALIDASYDGQVLVTTHSSSLLDGEEISVANVLVVTSENGRTTIGPIDEVSRSIIRDHLLTPGELLQQGQLFPEPTPDAGSAEPSTTDPMPVGR